MFFTIGADGKNPSVGKNVSVGKDASTGLLRTRVDVRMVNFTLGRPFRLSCLGRWTTRFGGGLDWPSAASVADGLG
jgi:hypothetical protein